MTLFRELISKMYNCLACDRQTHRLTSSMRRRGIRRSRSGVGTWTRTMFTIVFALWRRTIMLRIIVIIRIWMFAVMAMTTRITRITTTVFTIAFAFAFTFSISIRTFVTLRNRRAAMLMLAVSTAAASAAMSLMTTTTAVLISLMSCRGSTTVLGDARRTWIRTGTVRRITWGRIAVLLAGTMISSAAFAASRRWRCFVSFRAAVRGTARQVVV